MHAIARNANATGKARARVLSDASGAAVKWTLEPSPRQGDTRRPSGADEVVLAYDGRVGNRTLVAADRLVHRLDDEAATPIAGWATARASFSTRTYKR